MTWPTVFYISHFLLWILVIGLAVSVLQLQRAFDSLAFLLERRASEGPAIGVHAPALLDLSTEPARPIDIGSDERGTVLWFVAAGCLPCRAHGATIARIADEFRQRVRTIVSCVGSGEEAAQFASHIDAGCRVLPDPDRDNAGRWRVYSTPFVILVDSDGVIRGKVAEISRAQLQLAIDRLLTEGMEK